MASPPAATILPTTACAPASWMSVITTLAPSRARVAAHAAPIPDAPPRYDGNLAFHLTHGVLPECAHGSVRSARFLANVQKSSSTSSASLAAAALVEQFG